MIRSYQLYIKFDVYPGRRLLQQESSDSSMLEIFGVEFDYVIAFTQSFQYSHRKCLENGVVSIRKA